MEKRDKPVKGYQDVNLIFEHFSDEAKADRQKKWLAERYKDKRHKPRLKGGDIDEDKGKS